MYLSSFNRIVFYGGFLYIVRRCLVEAEFRADFAILEKQESTLSKNAVSPILWEWNLRPRKNGCSLYQHVPYETRYRNTYHNNEVGSQKNHDGRTTTMYLKFLPVFL